MATFTAQAGGSNMLYFFGWNFLLPIDAIVANNATASVTNFADLGAPYTLTYTGTRLTALGTNPAAGTYFTIIGSYNGLAAGVLTGISGVFSDIGTANRYLQLAGNNTLNGTSASDLLFGGFGGSDTFNGGGSNDTFMVGSDVANAVHHFNGSAGGTDTITVVRNLSGFGNLDLQQSTFQSIEKISMGADVDGLTFNASQFSTGFISLT